MYIEFFSVGLFFFFFLILLKVCLVINLCPTHADRSALNIQIGPPDRFDKRLRTP